MFNPFKALLHFIVKQVIAHPDTVQAILTAAEQKANDAIAKKLGVASTPRGGQS